GARTHNLRGVDVDLPLGKLIVMTGVSGSGKSSLAFDTVFAEGQRRYLESVSVHTRGLLKQLPRPDVDEVSGLPPTVSVDQRVSTAPIRNTLAMTTEIYDYLRLLYARAGTAHCTRCGQAVASQSVDQIPNGLLCLPERTRLMVLAPLVRDRRGAHKEVLASIARNGFVRVRLDGNLLDISQVPELDPARSHSIDAVIDRIIIKEGVAQRLRESVELAVRESDGTCVISIADGDGWSDRLFSTRFHCATCDLSFPTPEPRTFSFSSAWGACPECQGFGVVGIVDDTDDISVFRKSSCSTCRGSRLQPFASAVAFLNRTIHQFTSCSVDQCGALVESWLTELSTNRTANLSQEARLVAAKTLPDILRRLECLRQVGLGYLALDRPTRSLSGGEFQRARLAASLGSGLYGACFVLDEPTSGLHPRDTQKLLQTILQIRDQGATVIVVEHDEEIMRAADFLVDLGPGAGSEGGNLLYAGDLADIHRIPDSPTARCLQGRLRFDATDLKEASRSRLISTGETDRETLSNNKKQVQETLPFSDRVDQTDAHANKRLVVRGAKRNNLRGLTVEFPLHQFVCVTGVSGSGKSSLVMETLFPVIEAYQQSERHGLNALADVECDAIEGIEHISRIVAVDNSAIGRNRRSCIATISGIWNEVRRLFARTRDARAKGYSAQKFSFNSGDGRCAACRGSGVREMRMSFLPDATVPCPDCRGSRFSQAVLEVTFRGLTVADILNLRIDAAREFFSEFASLNAKLSTFHDVGLGYLTLGQPASTFSGGEAQRIRLAVELAEKHSDHTLYVLDEPTSGLHPADIIQLLRLLRKLVAGGHSVVVVEHNVDVMLASDWIIDIGPESGPAGGTLVAAGPPPVIAAAKASMTGRFLGHGNSCR
ncbi:MAG: hypothetical protein KDA81_21120, partial [Planctomycetaceae bacterium]|nr:hypothetical protein [Planctomycetaceae bacterium]